MKIVVVLLFFCFAAIKAEMTEEQKMRLVQYNAECMIKTGVSYDAIREALIKKEIQNNIQLQCFVACVLKRIGILNDDATINVESLRSEASAEVSQEIIDRLITTCKDVPGANECERASNLVQCFVKNKT